MLLKKAESLFTEVEMFYKTLGNIPVDKLQIFKDAIMPIAVSKPFSQVVKMDPDLISQFYKILFPDEFIVKYLADSNSKIFISPPNKGCEYIHKDGLDKKCALNVVIDCNPTDWVRWYDDDEVFSKGGKLETVVQLRWPGVVDERIQAWPTRKITNLLNYQLLDHVEEYTGQTPGDFYLINTDVFHFFRNVGTNYRLVIQTKFSQNDPIEELYEYVQQIGLNF